jgi:aryl-alcohol dehydrogenase-like predicted oxidoreductase
VCLTAVQDKAWGAKTTSLDEFGHFLDRFHEAGYDEVDTSRVYQNGEQEGFTAAVGWKERGLKLATKARRSDFASCSSNLAREVDSWTHRSTRTSQECTNRVVCARALRHR